MNTGSGLDIAEINREAMRFAERLRQVKRDAAPAGFPWYPYDSLANFQHLDKLLTGERRALLRLAGNEPVLDAGCADGDLAFFLETLGCRVHALDHEVTHHNGMRGVRLLREALRSGVEVYDVDFDRDFRLPRPHYGLTFLLGVAYHLKNPYRVLEELARRTEYCVLSTRIARRAPDGTAMEHLPVAYLADAREVNQDDSNFWIFSDAGFRRLLKRTRWQPLDYFRIGDTVASDPVHPEHDERVFCLARSTYGFQDLQLLEGWHSPEEDGWRWTERRFRLSAMPAGGRIGLTLEFFVPPLLIERFGSVTLSCTAGGQTLSSQTYSEAGIYRFVCGAQQADTVVFEFSLDRALAPSAADERELGIIVGAIDIES
jgi:hypothetical protein